MAPRDLLERTRLFALAVLEFCRQLPPTREAQEAASQLRRAANSTRSNYRAARKGRSRAEFQSRLQTAFEEADECVDWLEYLRDGRIRTDGSLLSEAREIASILGTAVRTARINTARLKLG
jgi:four helix bundle protein